MRSSPVCSFCVARLVPIHCATFGSTTPLVITGVCPIGYRLISGWTPATAGARNAGVGTNAIWVMYCRWMIASQERKAKVLFFATGPPAVAPNWFILNGGVGFPSEGLDRESALLRRYSNPPP